MRIKIISPLERQIFQQNSAHKALIPILGRVVCFGHPQLQVLLSIKGSPTQKSESTEPILLNYNPHTKIFHGTVELQAGGWYSMDISLVYKKDMKAKRSVQKIGVGEVFITLGQSNSANSGAEQTIPQIDFVSAWDGKRWGFARDPQPIATNTGGSPWPSMADFLYSKLKVPVGFFCIGVGGSAIGEWQKETHKHYQRFLKVSAYLNQIYAGLPQDTPKIRAMLWHQGETDCLNYTTTESYSNMLSMLIHHCQEDLKQIVPWGIAQATHHPDRNGFTDLNIILAQEKVAAALPNFLGPNTDNFVGKDWRHDNVHFNKLGLKKHGEEWANCIINWMENKKLI